MSLIYPIIVMKSSLLTLAADLVSNALQFCCPEAHYAHEASEKSNETRQDDDSCLQVVDASGRNRDEILDHSLPVLSAFHRFYRLAGVKASVRIRRPDDETLAEQTVLGTRMEDDAREAPADWKICVGRAREELCDARSQVKRGEMIFHCGKQTQKALTNATHF